MTERLDQRLPGSASTADVRCERSSSSTGSDDGSCRFDPPHSVSPRQANASPGFRIRRLRPRDVWAVVHIEWTAFPDDPWTTLTARGWLARSWIGNHPRTAARMARLIRLTRVSQVISTIRLFRLAVLRRPAGVSCVVAETGTAIVGYACLSAVPGGVGDIQMIAVAKDQQGQGIGSALLVDLMTTAADRDCTGASLYVRADNPRACRLYRRTGFAEVGTVSGYYQPSGTDAIMMRIDFTVPAADALPR
jgi:ribosomal-protein-alanine acetyltransferase